MNTGPLNIAFVHERLTTFAGSEKVVEAALDLFPGAPVFTLLYSPEAVKGTGIAAHPIHPSFVQRLPFARYCRRLYLPLFPLAATRFDLREFDLIFSSHHTVAKGIRKRAGQLHICYIHTPMRYAWDQATEFRRRPGATAARAGPLARVFLHFFRRWDVACAKSVDVFVANSQYIAERVGRAYGRQATVVYPPVDVDRFTAGAAREDFYLTVGRMVPYKRVDLIVEAFTALGRPLVVIGNGAHRRNVEKRAGPNIRFLGQQTDAVVADYLQRCRAFVFAAEEDFGIAPVEAQAAGAPVIAYGRGGCRETVLDGQTGLFFDTQTAGSLRDAVTRFESRREAFDAQVIRRHAQRFSRQRFQDQIKALIEAEWERHRPSAVGREPAGASSSLS